MRISDWSSDVCSSDLPRGERRFVEPILLWHRDGGDVAGHACSCESRSPEPGAQRVRLWIPAFAGILGGRPLIRTPPPIGSRRPCAIRRTRRSEENTSELQSLMRISYAFFCLTNKNKHKPHE